ncbi:MULTISPECIES: hypothetical protein [Proteiniclasticum]|uniref:Abortive infection C-terminus n=1 Tax=Proteiniclasticum ruminis TaxID=398199 RepID=A0A1G8RRP0_9CLOT|nr:MULTISPECIES: hypothetical protein [Proteiniclasticum]SDJ19579.1 hypothetical protein SAMN05421804_10960 [Proteiniclasticum ruminis]
MAVGKIDDTFISYASDILGETTHGLSGTQIVKYCNSYAVDFDVEIPITSSDFGSFGKVVPNKRTALYLNLREFNAQQQFVIIKDLCELTQFENNESVQEVKKRLFERYSQYSLSPIYLDAYQLTGWERVDRSIQEMRARLEPADTEEKFQAIGMIGRETLITIAQQVFDPQKHPTLDGVEASTADAKRMLEAYIQCELAGASEKVRKYARVSVDLANQLTHDRGASKREASICLISVISIASLIKTIHDTECTNINNHS